MKSKLLSIVIPIYNLEKYISETIISCLNQNIPQSDYEIICINDGSTDNSEQIIKKLQSSYNNIVLYSQPNAGVSAARNKGIELANGKYLWFLDGDDLILPNCLKTIIDTMEKTSAESFLFRSLHFTDTPVYKEPSGNIESCSDSEKLIPFMEYNGGAGVCGNIYKTDFLKEHSLFFSSHIKYSEDVLYNFKVLLNLKIAAKTSDAFLIIRYREDSTIHSTYLHLEKHIESMLELANEYNALNKLQKEPKRKKLCLFKRHLAVKALLFGCFKTGSLKLAKEKTKQLKELKFYPYPLLWSTLTKNKSLREIATNYISFLFPLKPYFYSCVWIISLFKNFKRRK